MPSCGSSSRKYQQMLIRNMWCSGNKQLRRVRCSRMAIYLFFLMKFVLGFFGTSHRLVVLPLRSLSSLFFKTSLIWASPTIKCQDRFLLYWPTSNPYLNFRPQRIKLNFKAYSFFSSPRIPFQFNVQLSFVAS